MNPNRPTRPQNYNNPGFTPPRRINEFTQEELFDVISHLSPNLQPQMGFQNFGLGNQNFGFNAYNQQNTSQHFSSQHFASQQFRPPQLSSQNFPSQQEPLNVEDYETVPDTPPSVTKGKQVAAEPSQPKKRSHKKKPPGEPRAKTKRTPWTEHEEMCLARAWIEITTDPNAADYQRGHVFWARIREAFFKAMGDAEEHRTQDLISGKWAEINSRCQFFNSCYNRKKNAVPSGESLLEWPFDAACKEYKQVKSHPFQLKKVWEFLHTHQKWLDQTPLEVRTTRPSKRSKTTSSSATEHESQASDAHTFINLNEFADEDDVVVELPRPAGRRSGKGKGISSSSSAGTDNSALSQIAAQIERLGDEAQKRRELKEKKYNDVATIIKRKDLDQLFRSTEGMSDEQRAINDLINAEIKRKYGLL